MSKKKLHKAEIEITAKQALTMSLWNLYQANKERDGHKDRALEALRLRDALENNVEDIKPKNKKAFELVFRPGTDSHTAEEILNSSMLKSVYAFLLKNSQWPTKEKLHRQPRNLLRTVALKIGNNTQEPNLFTMPPMETGGAVVSEVKKEISRNTAALAIHLIEKYQENGNEPLEIKNLNAMAEVMGCNNYRLKLYLLHLGGYVFPLIDKEEKTGRLRLTNELLFKVEFLYGKQVADKYTIGNGGVIQGAERIGNNVVSFIKDEPTDLVRITPNQKIIEALQGKGLGNILTVNNDFVGLILELTDIATKILCYSSSQQPSHKIKEDNLVKHLGLEKQSKQQGKPRIRKTIIKGLQELQDKGHIERYSYNETTGMYSFTYSEKYVKHPEHKKRKIGGEKGVQ